MAWMNQEKKAKIAIALKELLKGTGIKYTLAVRTHYSITMTITQAPFDFLKNYTAARILYLEERRKEDIENGCYHGCYDDSLEHLKNGIADCDIDNWCINNYFDGEEKTILGKIWKCLNIDNWDKSEPETDYYDVGYYVRLFVGGGKKSFKFIGSKV